MEIIKILGISLFSVYIIWCVIHLVNIKYTTKEHEIRIVINGLVMAVAGIVFCTLIN